MKAPHTDRRRRPPGVAMAAALEGGLAALLSALVLSFRGRAQTGSYTAPLNAPSHWVWGDEALRRDGADVKHTVLGTATHFGSAVMWGLLYEMLRRRRSETTPGTALVDAAAVTTLAAVVDFKIVPDRLTPGFERRLTPSSIGVAYGALALGLALGGLLVSSARR